MYFNQKSILAADYLRLSREDGDKLESDSIRNQRSLINDFVKQHPDITLVDEYIDDGYSGTNFERPAFKRLLEDVKKKKINCIIVKDLSRLGRNYIETGRYLEKIFPFLGVRFIAITDHYDSAAESDDADQIIVPFKNLINDAYCRDISIKIRSQLDVKRKNGQFIGSFACIVLGFKLLPYMGFLSDSIEIFGILTLGALAYICMNFLIIMLLYFDARSESLKIATVFLITTIVLSIITVFIGKEFYGYGFFFSSIISMVFAFNEINKFFNRIEYHIFADQPMFNIKKKGIFSSIYGLFNKNKVV